jgi:type II secretory pathway pseudopilin PulG
MRPTADRMQHFRRRKQKGYVLLLTLFGVAIISLGLARAAPNYAVETQRERERELLRLGALYADAIRSYYRSSPGTAPAYPAKLEDLLEDRRFVGIRRHMRAMYWDPILGSAEWGLVPSPDGGIAGVYSRSTARPSMLNSLFDASDRPSKISDVKFVFIPER